MAEESAAGVATPFLLAHMPGHDRYLAACIPCSSHKGVALLVLFFHRSRRGARKFSRIEWTSWTALVKSSRKKFHLTSYGWTADSLVDIANTVSADTSEMFEAGQVKEAAACLDRLNFPVQDKQKFFVTETLADGSVTGISLSMIREHQKAQQIHWWSTKKEDKERSEAWNKETEKRMAETQPWRESLWYVLHNIRVAMLWYMALCFRVCLLSGDFCNVFGVDYGRTQF